MKKLKMMLSMLVVIALTASMLGYLTKLVERKNSHYLYESFYEETENYDVLFLGSSRVLNGVFPMELWNDYGIVSYNCGIEGARIPVCYWVLRNVLEFTSPRLVVIDCYAMTNQSKGTQRVSQFHNFLDELPLGTTKIETIWDIVEEEYLRPEFVWNFSLYHNRWNEIVQNDFESPISPEKGAESNYAVSPIALPKVASTEILEEDGAGTEYLRRIIKLCQEQGIEVLLTYLPFYTSKHLIQESNKAQRIAEEYGVNFISYSNFDSVVDPNTDCANYNISNSHLNPSGARKITDYLGQYITEHYEVPDHREDSAYIGWHDDYREYTEFKLENLAAQDKFEIYLMLLHDKNLSYCVYLSDNNVWHNNLYNNLFANASLNGDNFFSGCPTLAVVDNFTGLIAYLAPNESVETSFGVVMLDENNGAFKITIDGGDVLSLEKEADAGAVVIANAIEDAVTASQFRINSPTTVDKLDP